MTPAADKSRRLAYIAWAGSLSDLGNDVSGDPRQPRVDAACADGRTPLAHRRCPAHGISRRTRPAAAAGVAMGRHLAARVLDARPRQRRCRFRRAVGAEWTGRGARRDGSILDGGRRGVTPDGERLRRSAAFGLIVGFSGIVLLVWHDLTLGSAGNRNFLLGIVALQIASIGWSIGSSYSKRQGHKAAAASKGGGMDEVLGTTAFQMLAGGLIMTAVGTLRGEWSVLFFTSRTTIALGLSRDYRCNRRVRRVHVCTAALASVVRVALRLHQSCDCCRSRSARAPRAIHVAHGHCRGPGICRRRARAAGAATQVPEAGSSKPAVNGTVEPGKVEAANLKEEASPERLSRTISGRGLSTRGRGG